MMRYENIVTFDLKNDSDEELKQVQEFIKEALRKRREDEDDLLYLKAWETNDPALIALGAAMMRQKHRWDMARLANRLPCEPSARKLAYWVADHRLVEDDKKLPDEEHEKLRQQILRRFDVSDFVFGHTHYDECHNGFYFRRS